MNDGMSWRMQPSFHRGFIDGTYTTSNFAIRQNYFKAYRPHHLVTPRHHGTHFREKRIQIQKWQKYACQVPLNSITFGIQNRNPLVYLNH